MNRVIIYGRLGADPERRDNSSDTAVVALNVATTERRKDGDGWTEYAEWHRVTAFGRLAETCAAYLERGQAVLVEGRLRTSSYEKNGEKRYSTEIIAERVQFGAKAGGGPRENSEATPAPRDSVSRGGDAAGVDPWADDDLPF